MEPKQQADWVMEQSLGKGAFGVVTLWKHRVSGAKIGNLELLTRRMVYICFITLLHQVHS